MVRLPNRRQARSTAAVYAAAGLLVLMVLLAGTVTWPAPRQLFLILLGPFGGAVLWLLVGQFRRPN